MSVTTPLHHLRKNIPYKVIDIANIDKSKLYICTLQGFNCHILVLLHKTQLLSDFPDNRYGKYYNLIILNENQVIFESRRVETSVL